MHDASAREWSHLEVVVRPSVLSRGPSDHAVYTMFLTDPRLG
jgi:hypothetical protein